MKIGGMNGALAAGQTGASGVLEEDAFTKNIKNQIAQAQKEMQQLSANHELSMEDKMKKRQELSQKITDLNNQLRQHQVEQRREKQQQMAAEKKKSEPDTKENLSKDSMKSMISADVSIKQAKEQGSTVVHMKAEANVLKMEIKQDASRSANVEVKQEKLSKIGQKIADAEEGQMKQLAQADKSLKEHAKDTVEKKSSKEEEKEESEEKEQKEYQNGYVPVDVRL